jgi:hypothetical protein
MLRFKCCNLFRRFFIVRLKNLAAFDECIWFKMATLCGISIRSLIRVQNYLPLRPVAPEHASRASNMTIEWL